MVGVEAMKEISQHAHVYILLAAAMLLGVDGVLSVMRMGVIEREYCAITKNQATIIHNLGEILELTRNCGHPGWEGPK